MGCGRGIRGDALNACCLVATGAQAHEHSDTKQGWPLTDAVWPPAICLDWAREVFILFQQEQEWRSLQLFCRLINWGWDTEVGLWIQEANTLPAQKKAPCFGRGIKPQPLAPSIWGDCFHQLPSYFFLEMPQRQVLDLFKQRLYSDPQWQRNECASFSNTHLVDFHTHW